MQPFRIVAVVPAEMPLGPAVVTLTIDSVVYTPARVFVEHAALGIFTIFGNLGPAQAQNVAPDAPPRLNQLTSPALPGQYVTLWATGLGDLTTSDVAVSLAGQSIAAGFAGHAPGLAGVDQINFRVPQNAALGCYVPVNILAGNAQSNTFTIAIAAEAGTCAHPLGLSPDELRTLDQGGSVFAGSMNFSAGIAHLAVLNLSGTGYTRLESFFAEFRQRSAFEIFLLSPKLSAGGVASSCAAANAFGEVLSILTGPQNVAGSSLTLLGPSNQTADVPASGPAGFYNFSVDSPPPVDTAAELPPPFFLPGPWQVMAPGGDTVSPFNQTYQLPPQIQWTNRESLTTFGRDADLSVTWNPQGYSTADIMSVALTTLSSLVSSLADILLGSGTGISCTVPAQSGQIIVPAGLLQQLSTGPATLRLSLTPQQSTLFSIPLTAGTTVPGLLSYFFSDSLSVTIQ